MKKLSATLRLMPAAWLFLLAFSAIPAYGYHVECGTDRALPALSNTSDTITYEVKAGDTLYRIAIAFGTTVEAIAQANNKADPNKLQIGEKLLIPVAPDQAKPAAIGRHTVSKVLVSTLTAYTAGYESTGKTPSHPAYGITYSGSKATEGRTIAVDPEVIPLGSLVYIEGIGLRKAEDVGSAIKGNRIDIFMEDVDQALKFGVKENVKVYVLSSNLTDA